MAASVDQFGKALVASGLMTADEVKEFWTGLAATARPKDGDAFAQLLIADGKLTVFQARELSAGRGGRLVMGDYVILQEIGAGGMGQVYKAMHRRMHRIVALKVMSAAAMKDEASVKRFQREVQAAARLEHPNIVTAYASGEAGAVKYLVMQFVDGGDLSSLVKQHGPLAVERAVDYVTQAARGLAYAHDEGVIHRDIKPANLLVDKKGIVKILDMGLARFEDGGEGLTATEQVMGTVDYMSPEQASNTKGADARADVYSLGCTLWFLLTGKKLYEGDSMIARLMAHRDAPLPSLVKARDDASWPLEQVLHKMIAKRADDRFGSMGEVVAALTPFGPEAGSSGGMGSSIGFGSGPANAELESFLKGPIVETVSDSQSKSKTPSGVTAKLAASTASDTKTSTSVRPAAGRPQSAAKKKGPPFGLIAGGVGGAALVVGAIIWLSSGSKVPEPAAVPAVPVVVKPTVVPPVAAAVAPSMPSGPSPAAILESTRYVWTEPQNLGRPVNDSASSRYPTLSADELCLVVLAEGGTNLREFRRANVDDPWGDPRRITGFSFETDPALSADGLTLLFSSNYSQGPGYVGGFDLWMRRRENRDAPWGPAQNLGPNINSPQDEGGPCLSSDGLVLAYHSTRPGGLGGRDLWVCRRPSPAAPFGPAENLGRTINGPGDDSLPRFLSTDGTLLFERNGDLFVTFRNAAGAVGAIELPNQTEKFYAKWPSVDGTRLYFQRDGRPGGLGGNDIWLTRRVLRDSPEAKAAPTPVASVALPKLDPVAFGGHCYQWIPGEFTWFDAQAQAEALGGHLISVTSPEESEWLKNTLLAKLSDERMVWIGGIHFPGDVWKWSTGEPMTYVDWKPGEGGDGPPSATGISRGVNDFGWSDWGAGSYAIAQTGPLQGQSRCAGFVVEWDAPQPTPPKPPEPEVFNGHRYLLVNEPLDWFDARFQAESQGGHLVTVESEAERDWLQTKVWPRVASIEGMKRFYLGGYQESRSESWKWVTGTPLDLKLWLGTAANDTDDAMKVVTWMYQNAWDDVGPRWKPLPYVIEWDDAGKP